MAKLKDLLNFKKRKKKKERQRSYDVRPGLLKIKANESYVFHSDYFKIDNYYATILMFRHNQGAYDGYAGFWGVNLIPSGLPYGVTTMNIDQVAKMPDGWVRTHQNQAEKIGGKNELAQRQGGSYQNKIKSRKNIRDLQIIAQELLNGAKYLHTKDRLLVKAPTLHKLDIAVDQIRRRYTDLFGQLNAAAYNGRQKQELYTLLGREKAKYGKGWYFTSTEYAGFYNLVTNGLDDPAGTYVGVMDGDVNSSAVLFDSDRFNRTAVVANEQFDKSLGHKVHQADMWGMLIAQTALINNHKVVQIVLDPETNLNKVGPAFKSITHTIDMNNGDVNMFEIFGKKGHELEAFPEQMEKLKLMTEQFTHASGQEEAINDSTLESILTNFYIHSHMWFPDARNHLDKIHMFVKDHNTVPRLHQFVNYLDTAYKAQVANNGDQDQIRANHVLDGIYHNLLSSNGQLFDTPTSAKMDGIGKSKRVVYDFGRLIPRGINIAMAQLVNVLSYAISDLRDGDILLIHGAEHIDSSIRKYCSHLFNLLLGRGGRIVYIYDTIDPFLEDASFNHFDEADYTIIGNMSNKQLQKYRDLLGSAIPTTLGDLITKKSDPTNYIHRGNTNVVFRTQLLLQPNVYDYGLKVRRQHY